MERSIPPFFAGVSILDWSVILSTVKQLFEGFQFTFGIFLFTLLFSIPLGLIVARGRMAKNVIVRSVVRIYISIMRGTPLMLQLLLVYFGPYYIFGISTGSIEIGPFNYRFIASIIGFSLNYAAYFAEIFRGGIQSMPKGQYEAAQVLGFTKMQTYFKIILPQAVKRVLPAVTNEVITLVKDTSLAFTLAYQEVFSLAKQISASETSFTPFVVAGIFYFVANYVVAYIMDRIEKSMSFYTT